MKITFPLIALLLLFSACETNNPETEALLASQAAQITELEAAADSLNAVILEKADSILLLQTANTAKPHISAKEREVRAMVRNLHQAWEDLPKEKDANKLLAFFGSKFYTNQVSIELDNSGNVQNYTNRDFKKYLKSIIKDKGFSVKFGEVDFFYTVFREDVFTTTYKTELQVFRDGKLQHNTDVLSIIAGRKADDLKIASYSWVTIDRK